ncbi:glutathione S-transferase [Methylotenera sp.]|uniref:glutathione S-transferase n=1 Tax=Methylotenera sp. TaxID=2051956 RepID=UPI002733AA4D|nr:glutathione S-transferase [Methylotenera sp.]MDP3210209.1 glutathione S-transferase [Methylotenera sp.]
MTLPILYSYRRCPYAMRARMALKYAGIAIEIREISLRDKPAHLLEVSPKATVPVLVLLDGAVLEQSLDIMHWALQQHDMDGWLLADSEQTQQLIAENDTSFKQALDRYKYAIRFPEQSMEDYRSQGEAFLAKLEQRLTQTNFLMGEQVSLADIAIFPFIRQFSAVDADWFASTPYVRLKAWLSLLVESELFNSIMGKYSVYSDAPN